MGINTRIEQLELALSACKLAFESLRDGEVMSAEHAAAAIVAIEKILKQEDPEQRSAEPLAGILENPPEPNEARHAEVRADKRAEESERLRRVAAARLASQKGATDGK